MSVYHFSIMWIQKEITLKPRSKGFHLVTDEILSNIPEIITLKIGLINILLKHTSASLTLNENADPDVRSDMKKYFDDFRKVVSFMDADRVISDDIELAAGYLINN